VPIRVGPRLAAGDDDPDTVFGSEALAFVIEIAEEGGECGEEIWTR